MHINTYFRFTSPTSTLRDSQAFVQSLGKAPEMSWIPTWQSSALMTAGMEVSWGTCSAAMCIMHTDILQGGNLEQGVTQKNSVWKSLAWKVFSAVHERARAYRAVTCALCRSASSMGEYRGIMNLCRVLPQGTAAKLAVDKAIDRLMTVGSIREDIQR